MPLSRTPDYRFKSDTESATGLKQQRSAPLRGATSHVAKPQPDALGDETEELVWDHGGGTRLVDEVKRSGSWNADDLAPKPQPAAPPEESLAHIISDTLRNPFGRFAQSINHLGTLLLEGRYSTAEETESLRKVTAPFDMLAKLVLPEVSAVASGAAAVIEQSERAATGEQSSPESLSQDITSPNAPRHLLGPAPPHALAPTSAFDTRTARHTTPAERQRSFNPPQRLQDGRLGYPLSPLRPPRLADPAQSEITAKQRPSPAAIARADAGPSTSRANPQQPAPAFREEFSLRTLRDPLTGAIQRREFAREEAYTESMPTPTGIVTYKTKVMTDGFTSNYRNKGLDAIVMHGSLSRNGDEPRLMYQRGREVLVQRLEDDQPMRHQTFDFQREVTPGQFVEYLKRDHQIDLVGPRGGGTGSAEAMYLMTCEAAAGGSNSLAQQFADATQREVRAHSRYTIRVADAHYLEDHDIVPLAALGHPHAALIKVRNALRPNSRDPAQLIHKKFQPRPRPVTSATSPAAAPSRPFVFQQYPRTEHSTFTPTQASSATQIMPSFTLSEPPASLQSSVIGQRPAGGGLRPGGSAFFDHVPPPLPPTQIIGYRPGPSLHASMSSVVSSQLSQGDAPSAGSTSDFFNLSSKPPVHPLTVTQASLPQHAVVSSSVVASSAKATGAPSDTSTVVSNELETWV